MFDTIIAPCLRTQCNRLGYKSRSETMSTRERRPLAALDVEVRYFECIRLNEFAAGIDNISHQC